MTYHPATAALLLDSYNRFLSEGEKVWPRLRATAEALHDTSPFGRPPPHWQDLEADEILKAVPLEAWRNLP